MFRFKQWLWIRWQRLLGGDRAYANYLKHFQYYQSQRVDTSLQHALAIKPMSKATFLAAWQKKIHPQATAKANAAANTCGCGKGSCH